MLRHKGGYTDSQMACLFSCTVVVCDACDSVIETQWLTRNIERNEWRMRVSSGVILRVGIWPCLLLLYFYSIGHVPIYL